MAHPPIKRYVLVPRGRHGGVQRFHLGRLERMEEVAARDDGRSGGREPGAGGRDGRAPNELRGA
jgi:hypothetical protein